MTFSIGHRRIGPDEPTYFIADIAASHDGELDRAIALVGLAAEAGADAAKFQNFTAREIVSDRGFAELGKLSHQASWSRSVLEVYEDASVPHDWTPILADACRDAGIAYLSTPYDFAAADMLDPYVPAFKIGSGDVTWLEEIEYLAAKGKPILIATGATALGEVVQAVQAIRRHTDDLVLMQCNTNYTGSTDNFDHVNLNVLSAYRATFPEAILGLSDHTPGHATTLGAIALGARVIEKHFTDDTSRPGPDHGFSMDPGSWSEMVVRSRELERALGHALKQVEPNETDTVVVQRRALRLRRAVPRGHVLSREDLAVLRPAPRHLIGAAATGEVVGRPVVRDMGADEGLSWTDVGPR